MREEFNVEIIECSTPVSELSPRERLKLKDVSNAVSFDTAVPDGETLKITPTGYAILKVHNDHAKGDKDYTQTIVIDANGTKYITGSQSFYNSFIDIWAELAQDDEPFDIEVFRKPSKNYAGKSFITCTVA